MKNIIRASIFTLTLGIVGVLAVGLTACDFKFGNDADLIGLANPVLYPQTYSITYRITGEDETIELITKTVTASGDIYYKDGEVNYYFQYLSYGYDLYEADESGEYTQKVNTVTAGYIETATQKFSDLAEQSTVRFTGAATETGSQTFLDRQCTAYRIVIGSENYSHTTDFLVDDETGICMQWIETDIVAGYEKPSEADNFVCLEFNV